MPDEKIPDALIRRRIDLEEMLVEKFKELAALGYDDGEIFHAALTKSVSSLYMLLGPERLLERLETVREVVETSQPKH